GQSLDFSLRVAPKWALVPGIERPGLRWAAPAGCVCSGGPPAMAQEIRTVPGSKCGIGRPCTWPTNVFPAVEDVEPSLSERPEMSSRAGLPSAADASFRGASDPAASGATGPGHP